MATAPRLPVWRSFLTAILLLILSYHTVEAEVTWASGVRNNSATTGFATWRALPNRVVSGFIDYRRGWAGMYAYASGFSPRQIRAKSSNVSFGHGLFPVGGSLAACAAGDYDGEQAEVARRLAVNGVGTAEIRLGWEASGDWFPWAAAGKPADQWKACFTNIAKAMKGAPGAGGLRIGWFQAKKGRIDVRTIYPEDDSMITNIGVSHYDDAEARFGHETYKGGPWGLRAWVDFARSKGKKFAIGEWGVGRLGDRPSYIQNMYDFLRENSDDIDHEAYFNTAKYRLYPIGTNPASSELYKKLF